MKKYPGIPFQVALLMALQMFASLVKAETPLIVAHRGASKAAPENTLPAFKLAWEQGADAIEGDFHLTRDGHIVCIHDGNTKKAAGTNLVVRNCSLADLQALDVGTRHAAAFSGTRIPTIKEVFETIPDTRRIYIEIKCGKEIISPLLEEIESSGLKDEQVVVICFNKEIIRLVKKQAPEYKAFWLLSPKNKDGQLNPSVDVILATLKSISADGLSTSARTTDEKLIRAMKTEGVEHHVWTINNPEEARKFMNLGVRSITTDKPGDVRKALLPERTGVPAG